MPHVNILLGKADLDRFSIDNVSWVFDSKSRNRLELTAVALLANSEQVKVPGVHVPGALSKVWGDAAAGGMAMACVETM